MAFRDPLISVKWLLTRYSTRWATYTDALGTERQRKELSATIEADVDAGILMANSAGLINNARSTLTDQKVYVGSSGGVGQKQLAANSPLRFAGTWNVGELDIQIDGGKAHLTASLEYASTDIRNLTASIEPEGISP